MNVTSIWLRPLVQSQPRSPTLTHLIINVGLPPASSFIETHYHIRVSLFDVDIVPVHSEIPTGPQSFPHRRNNSSVRSVRLFYRGGTRVCDMSGTKDK
jgi:hypothetical protein